MSSQCELNSTHKLGAHGPRLKILKYFEIFAQICKIYFRDVEIFYRCCRLLETLEIFKIYEDFSDFYKLFIEAYEIVLSHLPLD